MSYAKLDANLAAIDSAAAAFNRYAACEHFRADLAAARFHLRRPTNIPPLIAILGGTGTGKSTLLNRLLEMDLTAANFRRTFTAGPIAVAADASHIPPRWLGIDHAILDHENLPARGQPELLSIVIASNDLTKSITLIDTPDLDGDQPTHHAQADRVFRWADAVLFLVTPEKYQMTELLPYYRLAQRYGLPTLFVMNKVQEHAVVDDYRQQIDAASIFILARDDAAFEPPADFNLAALRQAIAAIKPQEQHDEIRIADLMDRLRDQLIEPARNDRREIDRLAKSLTALETPALGVDVNPLTQQLQRRLQQRSVLYLMGPARVLDRVRQVPKMLARLPRTTWDLLRAGKLSRNGKDDLPADIASDQPNFRAVLIDQFTIVQSRIDDLLRSSPSMADQLQDANYAQSKLDPSTAGDIADDEIAKLKDWLTKQWNATPRDTAILQKLLKLLPGGAKLAQWSEAAPYLLAIVVAAHHAFFGHVDLLILGGWSLATWLTEKLSNEVSARTRAANNAIAARFTHLAHRQIKSTLAWLQQQAPTIREIEKMQTLADEISESLQTAAAKT